MAGEITSYWLARGSGVVSGAFTPTAPTAFTAGQWSVADATTGGTATVTISALPSNGGSAITAIQYQVGAGSWTNSGISSPGAFNITGLTNGASVNIKVRAVNAFGNGPDSDTKSVTPTAAVLPNPEARLQPNAVTVTGTTTDAANQTALLAAKARRVMTNITTVANTPVVIEWDLPALAVVPYSSAGAVLYLTTATGAAAARTLKVERSTDGGSTYTDITPAVLMQTVAGTNNIDQLFEVPAGAECRLRFTYTSTTAHQFRVAIYQLQPQAAQNPFVAISGMSITISNTQGGQVRDKFDLAPTKGDGDLCFVAVARSGATPTTMLTEQLVGLVQPRPYIGYVIIDWGPNFLLQSGLKWDNVPETGGSNNRTRFRDDVKATLDWATAQGRKMTPVGVSFCDLYTGYPAEVLVNQPSIVESGASVSVSNQDNAQRGYLQGLYLPAMAVDGRGYDAATGLPKYDGYAASILAWDAYENLTQGSRSDGVHPVGPVGSGIYISTFIDASLGDVLGQSVTHVLKRRIDDYKRTGATSVVINRLYLALNSMPSAMDAATRSAWSALIASIPTTYQEPAGTPPTTLPGIFASFDFDDPTTVFWDDAATKPARDWDLAHVINNKASAGGKLFNAQSVAGAGNYGQPIHRADRASGRFTIMHDGVYASVSSTDAAIVSALDTAQGPFIFGWAELNVEASLKNSWRILNASSASQITVRTASGSRALQVLGSSVLGTESVEPPVLGLSVLILTYDGTVLKLRRNGVETISANWNRPAWAGATLQLGVGQTSKLGWHAIVGYSVASRDALEARLRAQAGV